MTVTEVDSPSVYYEQESDDFTQQYTPYKAQKRFEIEILTQPDQKARTMTESSYCHK